MSSAGPHSLPRPERRASEAGLSPCSPRLDSLGHLCCLLRERPGGCHRVPEPPAPGVPTRLGGPSHASAGRFTPGLWKLNFQVILCRLASLCWFCAPATGVGWCQMLSERSLHILFHSHNSSMCYVLCHNPSFPEKTPGNRKVQKVEEGHFLVPGRAEILNEHLDRGEIAEEIPPLLFHRMAPL